MNIQHPHLTYTEFIAADKPARRRRTVCARSGPPALPPKPMRADKPRRRGVCAVTVPRQHSERHPQLSRCNVGLKLSAIAKLQPSACVPAAGASLRYEAVLCTRTTSICKILLAAGAERLSVRAGHSHSTETAFSGPRSHAASAVCFPGQKLSLIITGHRMHKDPSRLSLISSGWLTTRLPVCICQAAPPLFAACNSTP